MKNLINQQSLSRQESHALFSTLNMHPPEFQAAILALLRAKRESLDEITGALDFFKSQAEFIDHDLNILDIVGTGGDGLGTFNISTTSSLLVSSAGVNVAKHGGGSATSQSGSADVMNALGVLPSCAQTCLSDIKQHQFAYLCAPDYNHAFGPFGPLRKKLTFPCIFNILGPLLNPLKPKNILLGVYRPDLAHKIATILMASGVKRALIVHGLDGLDEISICQATHVIEINEQVQKSYKIVPEQYGFKRANIKDIQGGTAADNADKIIEILQGTLKGPAHDCTLLNSAGAFYISGATQSIKEGIDLARSLIESGQAISHLNQLRKHHELS